MSHKKKRQLFTIIIICNKEKLIIWSSLEEMSFLLYLAIEKQRLDNITCYAFETFFSWRFNKICKFNFVFFQFLKICK